MQRPIKFAHRILRMVAGVACLLAATFENAGAGIVGLNYQETPEAFEFTITGDAVDATASATFNFGSDWLFTLAVQEIAGAVDSVTLLATAQHLALSPPAAGVFTLSTTFSGSQQTNGVILLVPFLEFVAHNQAGEPLVQPYDFYSGASGAATTNGPLLPNTDQITDWTLTIRGSHVPEPASFALLGSGFLLAGIVFLWRNRREAARRAPSLRN